MVGILLGRKRAEQVFELVYALSCMRACHERMGAAGLCKRRPLRGG